MMMRRSTTIHYDDSDGVCGVVCFTVVALVVRFVGFGEAARFHRVCTYPWPKAYFRGDDKALTLYGTQSLRLSSERPRDKTWDFRVLRFYSHATTSL